METFILNNGVKMPVTGLGTFPMVGEELIDAVTSAVNVGYNAFDTATAYKNEGSLKLALKKNFSCREEVFITTKLSNKQQRTLNVKKALTDSLELLGVEYVDLYLMHWPNPETYIECYKQMEEIYREGLTRAIGVCNFNIHHLEKLQKECTIIPAVNQFELHPLLQQKELVNYCNEKGIQVTAYTPLARMDKRLIENLVLEKIAKKYSRPVTQIILRWDYQNGYISIPKSGSYERQLSNIQIFDFNLDEEDMQLINDIDRNIRVRHDPDNCDFTRL